MERTTDMGSQAGETGVCKFLSYDGKKVRNRFFEILKYRVTVEKSEESVGQTSEASVKLRVNNEIKHVASDSERGPLDALDKALRRALEVFYPSLKSVRLTGYKVSILPGEEGVGAKIKVLIESVNNGDRWLTVGVSENVIEASLMALVNSFYYFLLKNNDGGH